MIPRGNSIIIEYIHIIYIFFVAIKRTSHTRAIVSRRRPRFLECVGGNICAVHERGESAPKNIRPRDRARRRRKSEARFPKSRNQSLSRGRLSREMPRSSSWAPFVLSRSVHPPPVVHNRGGITADYSRYPPAVIRMQTITEVAAAFTFPSTHPTIPPRTTNILNDVRSAYDVGTDYVSLPAFLLPCPFLFDSLCPFV